MIEHNFIAPSINIDNARTGDTALNAPGSQARAVAR